ncbi:MAG: Tim44/TimA family putative adaptor protein [Pseudomonadota bacterium]
MDFLTILFLILAAVIFFRLRSVLGTRTGQERPPQERVLKRAEKEAAPKKADTVVNLPRTEPARDRLEGVEAGSAIASALQFIVDADPAFRVPQFINGAKAAYEMILAAFANGDRTTLRKLLSPDIYATFEQEITARESRGEKVEFHFVGITKADITEAVLKDSVSQITVHFVAKLVQATMNANGDVIEGDAVNIDEVGDRWTFERKVTARDPNWKLVAAEDA